jgi:hypothetical protein
LLEFATLLQVKDELLLEENRDLEEILVSSHQDHVTSAPPITSEEPDAVEHIELDSSAAGGSPKKRQHDQLVNEPVKPKEEVKEYPYHTIFCILSVTCKIKMFYHLLFSTVLWIRSVCFEPPGSGSVSTRYGSVPDPSIIMQK